MTRIGQAALLLSALALAACAGSSSRAPCDASADGGCVDGANGGRGLGLRVALSDSAKSVCVFEEGCGGAPKGAIQIQPLQPELRRALGEALVAAGFELVDHEAERDVLADVEWRGTDTIALRLQDGHGRVIDQASFRRSLERCRDLPELTWDSCWAANFPRMKDELTRPLRQSAALRDFASRQHGGGVASGAPVELAPTQLGKSPALGREALREASAGGPLPSELDARQIQETVARYREELRRACWLPALEARDPSAPSSARVSTALTIGASGHVESVSASGDPLGYPRLASCIVTELRRWRFPAAQRGSAARLPFVFVGD